MESLRITFRSVADLAALLRRKLYILPPDIDLVVGIPRSGMLPAALISLYLNVPLADLKGFINGDILDWGLSRKPRRPIASVADCRRVLVIDDSVNSGRQMKRAKEMIDATPWAGRVVLGAVYVSPRAKRYVDIFFEVCPPPRIFEWNVMHHGILRRTCIDIDGILCRDPLPEENDDGPRYRAFLETVPPLLIPTVPVYALVTCRLEKYRELTERWLKKHGVEFEHLFMMPHRNAATRRATGDYAEFKAKIYRASKAVLFIESSYAQAKRIAQLSGGKPVL